jgi:hypothetical protein
MVFQLFELAVRDEVGREQAAVAGVNQHRRDEEWILKAAKKLAVVLKPKLGGELLCSERKGASLRPVAQGLY